MLYNVLLPFCFVIFCAIALGIQLAGWLYILYGIIKAHRRQPGFFGACCGYGLAQACLFPALFGHRLCQAGLVVGLLLMVFGLLVWITWLIEDDQMSPIDS